MDELEKTLAEVQSAELQQETSSDSEPSDTAASEEETATDEQPGEKSTFPQDRDYRMGQGVWSLPA